MKYFIISVCAVLFLTYAFYPIPVKGSPEYSKNFQAYLDNENLNASSDTHVFKEELKSFYKETQYAPVWLNQNNDELQDINEIHNTIQKQAYENGLNPNDYNFAPILDAQTNNNDGLFEKEWQLSNQVIHYINDIRFGRIDPHEFDSKIFTLQEKENLAQLYYDFINTSDKEEFLEGLAPPVYEYDQLKKNLSAYRKIKEKGGWPQIDVSVDSVINPGDSHEAVPQIRKRLSADFHNYDGKLPAGIWIDKSQIDAKKLVDGEDNEEPIENNSEPENPEWVYDKDLAKRVAEFQYFNGKKADGVIGPNTVEILNRPVEQQIQKIKLAMERWKWLPDDLGQKNVQLNIAAHYARAIENGQEAFTMPIIVGQVAHQTPIFSSVITDVKMHPDWTAPKSIADRYLIEKIQNNPSVIDELGYQAIERGSGDIMPLNSMNLGALNSDDYIFRQKPGNKNALGLARFSIDNDYAIFMHGTPKDSLFEEFDRTFSSGCIRLEDPLKMAKFLLDNKDMSEREIEELYYLEDNEHPETTIIELKNNVPVHITYMTAWIDQKGYIHFADDEYGRDEKLAQAFSTSN